MRKKEKYTEATCQLDFPFLSPSILSQSFLMDFDRNEKIVDQMLELRYLLFWKEKHGLFSKNQMGKVLFCSFWK